MYFVSTVNPEWISNYIHYKMWNQIIHSQIPTELSLTWILFRWTPDTYMVLFSTLWIKIPENPGPLYQQVSTLILAWMSNHMSNKVCDDAPLKWTTIDVVNGLSPFRN